MTDLDLTREKLNLNDYFLTKDGMQKFRYKEACDEYNSKAEVLCLANPRLYSIGLRLGFPNNFPVCINTVLSFLDNKAYPPYVGIYVDTAKSCRFFLKDEDLDSISENDYLFLKEQVLNILHEGAYSGFYVNKFGEKAPFCNYTLRKLSCLIVVLRSHQISRKFAKQEMDWFIDTFSFFSKNTDFELHSCNAYSKEDRFLTQNTLLSDADIASLNNECFNKLKLEFSMLSSILLLKISEVPINERCGVGMHLKELWHNGFYNHYLAGEDNVFYLQGRGYLCSFIESLKIFTKK